MAEETATIDSQVDNQYTDNQTTDEVSQTPDTPAANEEIIQLAKDAGWREDGQWDAKTFLKKKSIQATEQGRELKTIKRMVETNNKLVTQTIQQKVQEQLALAQTQKEQAIYNQDIEQVKAIDAQIETLKKNQPTDIPAEALEFIDRNPWIDTDKKLVRKAVFYRDEYFSDNPNGSLSDALNYAEKEMRREYPDKAGIKAAYVAPPSGVESGKTTGSKSEPWQQEKSKMTPFEKQAMDDMIKQIKQINPKYSEKEYIETFMGGR